MVKDRNVKIYVKPNPDPTGKEPYIFTMNEDEKGATNELVFNKDTDKMHKDESYSIKFKLKNEDGAALRFSKDPTKVLWAKPVASKSDPCPDSDCYMPGVFYVDPDEDIEDEKLVVINTDPAKQLFKFAFNFLPPGESDPPPSGYVWYDPIGNNENGGWSRSLGSTAAMTIGGGAIGAAACFLVSEAVTTQSLAIWVVAGALAGLVVSFLLGSGRTEARPTA